MKQRLFLATLVALFLGTITGLWLGPEAHSLGQLGKLVVRALKAVAIPMLFFAILGGVASSQLTGRGVRRLLGVAAFNALCALGIALLINHLVRPGSFIKLSTSSGEGLPSNLQKPLHWWDAVGSFIPDNMVAPFMEGSTTGVIIVAVLLGLALRQVTSVGTGGGDLLPGLFGEGRANIFIGSRKDH